MFHSIYVGSTSACFELDNRAPFLSPAPYSVVLDGVEKLSSNENVFSLFDLAPDRDYSVALSMGNEEACLAIHTQPETCAVSVRAFGAVGDGIADDTAAIQRAVNLMPEGGRLVVPEGAYLTGPILLKSHMTLELQAGATLLGRTDKAAYPVLPATAEDIDDGKPVHFGAFEGLARDMYASLITAEYARGITIVGRGRLDGNAQNADWWQTFKDDPVARPRVLFMNRCEGVTIHGLTACNSPSWHLHPYYCKGVALYDVSVSAPKNSPNTDALDPECCDGVEIVGCRFSVGDDCIAIKSGKLPLYRMCPAAACYCDGLPEMPIDEVTFENVRVAFAEDARPAVPSMFTGAPERCRMGLYFENVRRVVLKNVHIDGQAGEPVVTLGVDEIVAE